MAVLFFGDYAGLAGLPDNGPELAGADRPSIGGGNVMALLRVLTGLNPGQLFPLERECSVLGRHPDCDIVLEVGAVSRQHALTIEADGNYYVEDLRSRNGTFVNDQQVVHRQLLSENDRVKVCDLVFVFHQGPPDQNAWSADEGDVTKTQALMVDDDRRQSGSTITSKVDVSSGSAGLQLTVNAEAKLKALVAIGQHLGRALALGEVLPKLLDSLFAIFIQADRGFVVLKNMETGELVPKAVRHRRDNSIETIRISRTIVNEVINSREAILSADAATDSRFDMSESIVDFHIHSMMCAPLINSEGRALGVIQIDTLDQRNRFNQDDLDVLASVACQAAVAVENAQLHEIAVREGAMERELVLAHKVQQGFLPIAPPRLDQYEFFDFYEPANQLGGDYYDYVGLPDGRLGILLADVSGKGISAALLVAKLSSEVRYCLATETSPAAAVARLNNIFCQSRWEDRFVTMVLTVLDPRRHEVVVINAGHMAPLLRRRSGVVEEVAQAQSGLPLGIDADVDYAQSTVVLDPGSCLTLYSDGITDAMNESEDFYGTQRLLAQIGPVGDGVEALGLQILDDVRRFVGNRSQTDDMCLTCFGRKEG